MLNKQKRRQFLSNTVVAATSAATVSACQASPNGPQVQANSLPSLRWRMVTSWPKLDTIYGNRLKSGGFRSTGRLYKNS